MPFLLSPGVAVVETDLTNIVPAVATNTGATVGQFNWGPVDRVTVVENEESLTSIFGKPDNTAYKDFFCSANFLQYARNLQLVRVVGSEALNAAATASSSGSGVLIKNGDVYDTTSFTSSTNLFIAKYPGALGNSIGVAFADTTGYNATNTAGGYTWQWRGLFTDAPGTNEFHVVVYDVDGKITGTAMTALEKFEFVSTVATKKRFDGSSAYAKNVLRNESNWIYLGKESLLTGTSNGVTLGGGANGSAITESDRQSGFALFRNTEELDISLIFASGAGTTASAYIISNVAEFRKDCVAFVSVQETDVVNIADETTQLTNINTTRTVYGSSSYAVMDSTYKYQYDRYNDVYRWVPLNGDIAGLCARTDAEADPWFSPAGLNRGKIKGVAKFASKQSNTIRDELYKKGVNPCVIFPTDGAVLFGDKTLQSKPSAFDRINVRRLFITLEKAISTASKYMLFEQNDERTRTRFYNMVDPFLRDVKGRSGIYDYRIVCDESVNTPDVIDRNEFRGQIWIKPVRSINYIILDFVAVRTGVSFDEIVQN